MTNSAFGRRVAVALAATAAIGGLTAVPAGAAASASASVSAPASASGAAGMTSSFVAYEGTSYSGRSADVNGCGHHTIPFHGSYKWIPRGQDGRMHNAADGRDPVHTVLRSNRGAEQSTPFGWQSIYIVC
ncbi:MiAMP1 family antimicrobial peptide [Streptomyces sp. URMC 126]|uniref:MiAMP1 family antimicrobial peptide n=1 Tax=Streptomyces sp. URMC 126 TaxID=3423401 RepID=UPI003F1BFDC6